MYRSTVVLLALSTMLTACGALGPHKAPSVSEGHIGQVLTASSFIVEGQSVLQYAGTMLDDIVSINSDVQRRIDNQDFIGAKRRVFDMAEKIEPRNDSSQSERPSLKNAITTAREHTQLAARADDASPAIMQAAPGIWQNANQTLADASTLTTYINFGLNADSGESLAIIADEIQTLALQIRGQIPAASSYSLEDYRRDLELMLASGNQRLVQDDIWYLQNFEPVESTGSWGFKKKPAPERDMFYSDNNNSGFSGGGDDDDDDDDDDD